MTIPKWHESEEFANPGKRITLDDVAPPPSHCAPEPLRLVKSESATTYGTSADDAQIARMVPIAIELATIAGAHGIIAGDIYTSAVRRGIITGRESGRTLSYIGRVPKAAGLVETGEFRRSEVPRSHGNLGAVWRLP